MQTKRCCLTLLAALMGISCLWAQEPTAVSTATQPVATVTTAEDAAPLSGTEVETVVEDPIAEEATPPVGENFAEEQPRVPELEQLIARKEISVTFRVNRVDIDPSYMDNATAIEAMVAWINGYNSDADTDIISVEICGSASPEGPRERNSYLSRARLQALEKYLRARIDIPEELIVRNDHYISLDHLARLVDASQFGEEEKQSILAITNAKDVNVDTRIAQLKELDGGRLWQMMLTELFPEMRNAYTIIVTRQHNYADDEWVSSLPLYSSKRNFSEDILEEYTEGDKKYTLRKKEKFITFRVGKSNIDTTYMDNAAALANMQQWIETYKNDEMVDLVSVEISGSASPEGSSSLNHRLAEERLAALEKYLRSNIEVPDSILVRNNHHVSLHHLAALVDASPAFSEAQKSLVYAVAYDDSQSVDERINKLKTFHGGKLWNKMLKTVFPDMRNAFAVIVTRKSELAKQIDEVVEEIEETYVEEVESVEEPVEEIPEEPVEEPVEEQPAEEPVEEPVEMRPVVRLHVKNNALMDAIAITNIGVEVDFADYWSFSLPVYYSAWNYFRPDLKFRVLGTQPELRFWPMGNIRGLFVGAHFGVTSFNIATTGEWRYQDHDGVKPAIGGGLSVGYRLPLSKDGHWNVEFGLGAGAYSVHYDEFYNVEDGLLANTYKKTYWGLDNVSVTFSYAFDLKKVAK